MFGAFASFGLIHQMKWSSQGSISSLILAYEFPRPISSNGSASSSINPFIYCENLLQIDLSWVTFPQLGELPSSSSSSVLTVNSGTFYIKMFEIYSLLFSAKNNSKDDEISSTFFSIKFLMLYSTSFAEWKIVNL